MARYFLKEQQAMETLDAELAALEQQLDEMREEHGGEEGLLVEVIEGEGEKQKITAKAVKDRLKEIGKDPDDADERNALQAYAKLLEKQSDAKTKRNKARHMSSAAPSHDPGGKVRPPWPADSVVTARFSDCQRYRYQLREIWDPARPLVLWLLMNPSVACLDYADPTLRKTGKFARAWGYGGQLVGNVHAYRATDKNRLLEVADPVGPKNDQMILQMAAQAETVVLAYGQPPKALRRRGQELVALLSDHQRLCHLRLAKDGTPVHPLYLPDALRPQPYRGGNHA